MKRRTGIQDSVFVVILVVVVGCASPRIGDEIQAGGIEPLPEGVDRVMSPDGTFSIGVVGRAGKGPGSALGHESAEFGLVLSDEDIGIAAYSYPGGQVSIDDVVHNRRTLVRSAGILRFVSEKRFFFSSGRYRAASLCLYEGSGRGSVRFAYALIADTSAGAVEVLGWTVDPDGREALREAVLRLQLESE